MRAQPKRIAAARVEGIEHGVHCPRGSPRGFSRARADPPPEQIVDDALNEWLLDVPRIGRGDGRVALGAAQLQRLVTKNLSLIHI